MYAVIDSGGKQERVEEGQVLSVELLRAEVGEEVSLRPVLLVDGSEVLSRPDELGAVAVAARVVGEAKGPKIRGFVYKNKTRARRTWGHRQHYTEVEILSITRAGAEPKPAPAKAAAPKAALAPEATDNNDAPAADETAPVAASVEAPEATVAAEAVIEVTPSASEPVESETSTASEPPAATASAEPETVEADEAEEA